MSRLIIRNLPGNVKEERVRSIFGNKGELTDLKLCYTKDGKFRKFAFVGYKTEDQAKAALKHFNRSFVDTSKISVEIAKEVGDKSLPRPWSKYSEGSSANQRLMEKLEKKLRKRYSGSELVGKGGDKKGKTGTLEKKKKMNKNIEVLDELADDPEFQEFLGLHELGSSKQAKNKVNTGADGNDLKTNRKHERKQVKYDDSDESGNEDDVYDAVGTGSVEEEKKDCNEENKGTKTAETNALSDMDYLRSKVVSTSQECLPRNKGKKKSKNDKLENDNRNREVSSKGSMDIDKVIYNEKEKEDKEKVHNKGREKYTNKVKMKSPAAFGTIKMRGLPFKAKEKDIKDFFSPLTTLDIRIIRINAGKPTGKAFVDFASESDIREALKRDGDCIEGKYIKLFSDKEEHTCTHTSLEAKEEKPWVKKLAGQGEDEEFESIAESGRLFLRNLAYLCSEEDLQELFGKFGPLTETYLPLDKTSNKPTGIGFVTFMMPEHAVKAFNELDGKIFQGRSLHILPSKAKETKQENTDTASFFKSKRDAKKKSLSGHDHNWNTLFLGMNAVADVMAETYNTTKGGILDDASSRSLAVRMALGETQVVTETRKFLVSQGVKLDVFGQPTAKRSKTVILVKNLPFNTTCDELRTTFEPFGTVARLVLPPSGITALVEFFEPSQAKRAFQKLAYSKFKHVPLYLEWAPLEVFSGKPEDKNCKETKRDQNISEDRSEENSVNNGKNDDEDSGNAEGTTVFVKNLNFDTSEETLKEEFSKIGPLLSAVIAKKKDPKKHGNLLSMGYGFVEYKKRADALNALKQLQNTSLEGHTIEIKMSHRTPNNSVSKRKSSSVTKQNSSKILVRNVPFEASKKEIKELFGTFGEIKTLRLPQKLTGTGSHRGFAFVDFLTKQDAKRAFESLCSSTHLYGRRLVLEWAQDEDSVDALRKRTAEHFLGTPKTAKKKKDLLDGLLDAEMSDD